MSNIVWTPLEDGRYRDKYGDYIIIDEQFLSLEDGDAKTRCVLPVDVRLCRAMPAPAPFDVEVQPPSSVRDMLALEADIPTDNVRYVVYNDAQRGEWLHKLPAPLEMPEEVREMLDKALSYWWEDCKDKIFGRENIDAERRRIDKVSEWLDAQRIEEATDE